MPDLRKLIEEAINSVSAENGSDTPDFVLAEYLTDCLAAFDKAVTRREEWYGRGKGVVPPPEDRQEAGIREKVNNMPPWELRQHISAHHLRMPFDYNDVVAMRQIVADHIIKAVKELRQSLAEIGEKLKEMRR